MGHLTSSESRTIHRRGYVMLYDIACCLPVITQYIFITCFNVIVFMLCCGCTQKENVSVKLCKLKRILKEC
jgi:hypothetical protein